MTYMFTQKDRLSHTLRTHFILHMTCDINVSYCILQNTLKYTLYIYIIYYREIYVSSHITYTLHVTYEIIVPYFGLYTQKYITYCREIYVSSHMTHTLHITYHIPMSYHILHVRFIPHIM